MSNAFKKAVSAILGLTLCAGMCACNQTQPGTSASGEPDASGAVEASGTDADAVYGGEAVVGITQEPSSSTFMKDSTSSIQRALLIPASPQTARSQKILPSILSLSEKVLHSTTVTPLTLTMSFIH